MSYEFYKVLHIVGLATVFFALGGTFASGGKIWSALHGIGLFLLIGSGFGMTAKGSLEFKGWVITMIGIWAVFAVLPLMVKRRVLPAPVVAVVALVLAGVAAWLGITRPF